MDAKNGLCHFQSPEIWNFFAGQGSGAVSM